MWNQVFSDAEDARRERGDHAVALEKYVPWREYVSTMNSEAYYVIYPASPGGWMLQCIPPEARSLKQRVPLPEGWAGMRNAELCEVTGISGATFCHPDRYIARATSKDAAIKLAAAAYKQQIQDEKIEAALALRASFLKLEEDQAG